MDTDLLKNFTAVAYFLNMTKAAEFRNISPSAVSKKLSALEAEMGGVNLMQRYPGKIHLTEEGEIFLKHVEKILSDIESTQTLMNGPLMSEVGPLKIHTMQSLGLFWLSGMMPEFKKRYPDIELEVHFDALKPFSLASHNSGVYAGLSTNEPMGDSVYIWKKLASYYLYPYAHPSYLEVHGAPKSLKELDNHKILRCDYQNQLNFDHDSQVNCLKYLGSKLLRPTEMTVDDPVALQALIHSGGGIGMLPAYMGEGRELVRILNDHYNPVMHTKPFNLYYVYPSFIKNYRRISLLKSFLLESLRQNSSFHDVAEG